MMFLILIEEDIFRRDKSVIFNIKFYAKLLQHTYFNLDQNQNWP